MKPLVMFLALGIVPGLIGAPVAAQDTLRFNDYPTEARADYVFGCMAANGQTQEALRKCACSIDRIAEVLPYEDYVEAEAVLRLNLVGGERTAMFRTAAPAKTAVQELRRAQAEAEILCF